MVADSAAVPHHRAAAAVVEEAVADHRYLAACSVLLVESAVSDQWCRRLFSNQQRCRRPRRLQLAVVAAVNSRWLAAAAPVLLVEVAVVVAAVPSAVPGLLEAEGGLRQEVGEEGDEKLMRHCRILKKHQPLITCG